METLGFELDSGVYIGWMGSISLERLSGEEYAVNLNVCKGWPSYNLGVLEDTVFFTADSTVLYTLDGSACAIKIHQNEDLLYVTQASDEVMACGFGNGVFADGVYRRKRKVGDTRQWYDSVNVDCQASLLTMSQHSAKLSSTEMDLLCNAFHPACKEQAAFRARVDELYHKALRQDPVNFINSLDHAEEFWQVPFVLYTLAQHAEVNGVDEKLEDLVLSAKVPNDWLHRRILRALEGEFY